MLFGHIVGFVSQSALPQKHQDLSGFWQAMLDPCGVRCNDRSNILGPDWGQAWPSWALLRYLEATALLLAAKLGDLEGKLGYRAVMLKLSWAILCHVEAICQILFAFPPAGPRFYVGFCQLCWFHWGPLGAQVRLSCGYVGTVASILGSPSAI